MTSTTARKTPAAAPASPWDAIAAQLDQLQMPVRTFKLCRSADVRERYLEARDTDEQAQQRLKGMAEDTAADARSLFEKRAEAAAAELAEAQKEYEAHVITLRFTALERRDLEALQRAHPASELDEERGDRYAMDTFGPALISAASLDGMPLDAATRYMNSWSAADAAALWQAAWSIQHQQRADLGKG